MKLPPRHIRRGKTARKIAKFIVGPIALLLAALRVAGAIETSWWIIGGLGALYLLHAALIGLFFGAAMAYEAKRERP